jgi:superfamily I DNA/RNA helicase
LTYARQRRLYGTQAQNLPSRFLTEIPADLMDFRNRIFLAEEDPSHEEIEVDYDE